MNVPKLNPCFEPIEDPISTNENTLKILTIDEKGSKEDNGSNILLSKGQLEEVIPIAVANEVLDILINQSKQLKPSDICILVNRHQQASSIRDGLAVAGIPSR